MHIYKWYNFLIHSSIHKQIVLMSLLLQMITINIGCRYLFKLVFLFILDIFPEVEMLDHVIALSFIFMRILHIVFLRSYTNTKPTYKDC